jgi:hypothetical protein
MGQHHLPHQMTATIMKSREPTKAPPGNRPRDCEIRRTSAASKRFEK